MDLTDLRCFLILAEELHFGRAARRQEMSPATLGRRLSALEDHLGTVLIHRTTRAVSLSPAGQVLVPQARDLVAAADALEHRARSLGRDSAARLRIGAIDSAAAGLCRKSCQFIARPRPSCGSRWKNAKPSSYCRASCRAGSIWH